MTFNPIWPVPQVVMPQHLWPFYYTRDYSDHGSTGGLTLTAGGSGNSFSANGLILNGSGWAYTAHDHDVNDLGTTWSCLLEVTQNTTTGGFCGDNQYLSHGMMLTGNALNQVQLSFGGGTGSPATWNPALSTGVKYRYIITYSGGNATFYLNGSVVGTPLAISGYTASAEGMAIGAVRAGDGYGRITGTVHLAGFLKGTAWSAQEVKAIYDFSIGAVGQGGLTVEESAYELWMPTAPTYTLDDYKDGDNLISCRVWQKAQ